MLQFLFNIASGRHISPLPNSPTFNTIWKFIFKLYFILFLRTPTRTSPTLADPTPTYTQEVPVVVLYCVVACVGFALCGAGMVFGRAGDSALCQAETLASSMLASPPALVSHTCTALVLYSPPAAPPTQLDNTLPSSPCSLVNEDEWVRISMVVIFMGILLMRAGEEDHSGVTNTEEDGSTQVGDAGMDAVDDTYSSTPSNDTLAPTSPIAPNWAFPEKRESITLSELVRVFTEAVGPQTPTSTPTPPAPSLSIPPTHPTPTPPTPAPTPPTPAPTPPTPPTPPSPAPPILAPRTPAPLPVELPATDHAPLVTKVAESKAGRKVRVRRTRAPRPGDWVSPRTESVSLEFVLGVANENLEHNAKLPLDDELASFPDSGKAPHVTPDWAFPERRESITLEELVRVHTESVESWSLAPPTFMPPAPAPAPTHIPSPSPPTPSPPIPAPSVTQVAKSRPGHKARVRRTRLPRPGDWVSPRTECVSMDFVLGVSHEHSKFNAELPLDAGLFGALAPPPSLPTPTSALGRSTRSTRSPSSGKSPQVVPNWAFPEKRESVTLKELVEEFK